MQELQNGSFCIGLLYGALVVAIIAYLLNQLRVARTQMGRRNQTLDNFPASSQPKLTPTGIVSDSQAAAFRYFVLLLVLVLAIATALAGVLLLLQAGPG